MNRWSSLALLSLALTACSQQAGAPLPDPVGNYDDVDGSWVMTPSLSAQALTPDGINTLYYERALVATSAWGPIEVDRSNGERGIGDGRTLTLNGTQHPKGYGVHAPSELKYSLAGTDNAKCVRFKAQVGVDDEVGNRGSAVFQVWGDGEKLYDSGVMTGASATKQVSVDLRGKSTFRMVVTDAGDGKSYDHADWINPTLTCVPDITATVSKTTGVYQDTHGNVPVTFSNNSKSFSGDLTYRLTSIIDQDDFVFTRFRLDSTGTRIAAAGPVARDVSVYMPARSIPGEASTPLPDALVIYAHGEEVARVSLRVYTLEQGISVSFPGEPFSLREGETRTVQGRVTVTPGGETTGPEVFLQSEAGPDQDGPWWSVTGSGQVPKEGGTIPVTITARRAPREGEEREPNVRLYRAERNFGHIGGSRSDFIKLRFVP